jgi:hypothetical protein
LKYVYIIEGKIFKHIFHTAFCGAEKIMKPWSDPVPTLYLLGWKSRIPED